MGSGTAEFADYVIYCVVEWCQRSGVWSFYWEFILIRRVFAFQTTSKLVDSRRVPACAIDKVRYLRCLGSARGEGTPTGLSFRLFTCFQVVAFRKNTPILTKEVFESDRDCRNEVKKNVMCTLSLVLYLIVMGLDRYESRRAHKQRNEKETKSTWKYVKKKAQETWNKLKCGSQKNSCACSVNFQLRGYECVLRQSKVSARFPLNFLEFEYNRIPIALT